jgi:folate-binding protein YgfZ
LTANGTAGITRLPEYGCFRITGPDAEGFLQGQFSSDVSALTSPGGQLSSFSDPKGRVIAVIRLLRLDDGYIAVAPRTIVEATARRLALFVLRSKVSLDVCEDLSVWGALGANGVDSLASGADAVLRMPAHTAVGVRSLDDADATSAMAVDPIDWETAEIIAGIPEIYPATGGKFVAQMLHLDRLGAISFDKGCYVGQEVIARAHHLGRVKRHARLFRLPISDVNPGDAVTIDNATAGTVVRVAAGTNQSLLLVVMRDDVIGAASVHGHELEAVSLPFDPGTG